MKHFAKIFLDTGCERLIRRAVIHENHTDSKPLVPHFYKGILDELLFGDPPELFFCIGVNRDIVSCFGATVPLLEFINEGESAIQVAVGDNIQTVPAHGMRRLSCDFQTVAQPFRCFSKGGNSKKTTVSARQFLGYRALYDLNLDDMQVCFEEGLESWESCYKSPAYWMRGNDVTSEQAFEIIRRTDSIFGHLPMDGFPANYSIRTQDFIPLHCFESFWFDQPHFGWCRPDGRIGIDSVLSGAPSAHELVLDGIRLLKAFPFLDLMVLIWDCEGSDRFDPMLLQSKGMPQIACGVRLHKNTIELLGAENAWRQFCEYQAACAYSPMEYWDGYNRQTNTYWTDSDYLDRCLVAGVINATAFVNRTSSALISPQQSLAAVSLRYQNLSAATSPIQSR